MKVAKYVLGNCIGELSFSMGIIFFTKKSKTLYLQGFWPKSVYLKCFGNQLKTVYLYGPHSLSRVSWGLAV